MQALNNNKLAWSLVEKAVAAGASDLHLEPMRDVVRVRIRVDGLLRELVRLPLAAHSTLVTQLKVAANMDIAEKRVPQDGRIALELDGRSVDLRLSTLPTTLGEKIAIRLLAQQELLQLEELGFTQANLACYRRLFTQPNGLILLTGPTGSGKTSTLYATLAELDAATRNIITLEDPVEYSLPGINQVAVNRRSGMTFAKGLRAIVRQDPDVIMLGEIRDEETAGIAVQAALTGHLVLSTLHTNSAAGAVYRLLDMGIAPYLLAAALRGVVAQRLVRRLCPACRRQRTATAAERSFLGAATVWEQHGCEQCQAAGYRGRVAVQEVLPLTARLQQLVLQRATVTELEQAARSEGVRSLAEDAAAKALEGLTTVQELWRVGITGGQDAV
ncbi:GspE/PulE family protein [uncultured Phascolarctobacterium sp.]|uniref:GspE/PulE family protein n=1 Tax=uncultured Phascolarctobacterium sp. TaxID=512296 RepID=UPI0025E5A69C|nr:GspE/PulE family protein [uncultured Phascolarctobacterium sp.]